MQKDWLGTQKVAETIGSKPKGVGFSKFLSGKISEEQGLCKEAIGQYKEALAITPDLPDALQGIVTCYEALNQPKAILTYLDEFMAAYPGNSYPWLLKSQLLLKGQRLDDALNVLSDAVGKWPKIPEFYETMAIIHTHKKETDKAIAVINQGLQAIPDQPRLSIMLASTYEQTGDYAKSLETYETLVAKHPTIDIAVNNLVSLLLDHFSTKENIDRAVILAKRFEHSDQDYFVDTYAWALINSGKPAEALSILRNITKKMPNVAVFKYHLGVAYANNNTKELAISELEEALKLGEKAGGLPEKEAAKKLLDTLKKGTSAEASKL